MMIFSLISAVNDSILLPACSHFPLDENKLVEPVIIGGDEERTVQFSMLLDQLKFYPYETADSLCMSINAVTPCHGESNAYQLAVSTGQFPLYVSEISELMKDFLYQHVVDANGYVKMTFPDICHGLNALWRTFVEENLSGTLKTEKVLCAPYIMPVSVLRETSSLEEEKMTLKDVMNFKKIQSAFKHELHSIQKSLDVLKSHDAVERFKENKTLELLLQTGVHTGIGIAGGVLGAVIGTAIAPGLGTFIGAGIGAGLAWVGKKVYDYVAGVVSNKINPNPHLKTQEIDRKIKSAEKGPVWECGAKIKSLVVEPSRAGGILVTSLISSVIEGVSLPVHNIATACYDYEKAREGLTPEKASKIEVLLVKYHSKLNKERELVLAYLEENPTPDNQRRKNKILDRDAVICERLTAIRESIKDAVESRC
ncbi:TPA: hypothetical protein N3A33_002894 [Salmonella enterica subsp. salamae serovar 28:r:e,n,z15]|nr:hypothetical protein [Salmonella enterica subsp. salamae serovar 28:r:e,n,z15]